MENSTLGNSSTWTNTTDSSEQKSSLQRGLYAMVLIVVMILIIVGNTLVLLVLYRQRLQHNLRVTNIFLANLAVMDLCIGFLMFPFSVTTVLRGAWVFGDGVCQMNGFTNMAGGTCTILTMAVISVDRYRAIVSGPGHKLQVRHALPLMTGVWLWGIVVGLLPILGWNEYVFAYGSICKMSFKKDPGYIMFAAVTCFVIPFIIMFYCYLRVFIKVRNHRKLMQRKWNRASAKNRESHHMRSETRTAKIVFSVLFVFSVAWTPYVIVHLLQASPEITLPTNVTTFVTLFAAMHSFYNPIIYVTMNRKFRSDLYKLFPVLRRVGKCCGVCCCCCRRRYTGNRVDSFREASSSSATLQPAPKPRISLVLHSIEEDGGKPFEEGKGDAANAHDNLAVTSENASKEENKKYEFAKEENQENS